MSMRGSHVSLGFVLTRSTVRTIQSPRVDLAYHPVIDVATGPAEIRKNLLKCEPRPNAEHPLDEADFCVGQFAGAGHESRSFDLSSKRP